MNAYEWTDEAGEHRAVLADTGMGREMIRLAGRVKELEQSVARLEATISAVEDELVDDLLPEKDQGLPLPERISWHLLYAKAGNEYGVTFLEARIKELEAESRQRERRVRELEQHHVNLSGLLFNQAATIQRQDVALAEWEEWFRERKKGLVWKTFMNLDALGALVQRREILDLREDLCEWEEWFAQVTVFWTESGDSRDMRPTEGPVIDAEWADDAATGESICIGADDGSPSGDFTATFARPEIGERELPWSLPVGDHSAGMVYDDVEEEGARHETAAEIWALINKAFEERDAMRALLVDLMVPLSSYWNLQPYGSHVWHGMKELHERMGAVLGSSADAF